MPIDGGPGDFPCPPGFATCGDDPQDICTTNLLVDLNNCGTCGTICTGLANECVDGVCCIEAVSNAICADTPCCEPNYYCAWMANVCTPYVSAGGYCDPRGGDMGICLPGLNCWTSDGDTGICE